MPPETKTPNNSEIDQALQEFEMKSSSTPQVPAAQSSSLSDGRPKMVRLVMKLSGGAITEQRTAEYTLLGFVVVAIAVSLFLFFNERESSREIIAPPGYKIIYPENSPPRLQQAF